MSTASRRSRPVIGRPWLEEPGASCPLVAVVGLLVVLAELDPVVVAELDPVELAGAEGLDGVVLADEGVVFAFDGDEP